MIRGLLAVALAALAAVPAAYGVSAKLKTYVPVLRPTSHALVVRPERLIVAGDGTAILTRVRYRSYGAPQARANGTLLLDDCRRGCADGTFHPVAARLVFGGIVRCHGKRVYTTLGIHAPGAARFKMLTDWTVALTYLGYLCEPGER